METNKLDKSIELIDIKNLHTTQIKRVKEWCEQELEFRNAIGKEIDHRKTIEKDGYPGGSFEHMVNLEQLKYNNGFAGEYEEGDDWADKK